MNSFLDQISVIEINPTELCNLKCFFCPRSTFYPNENLNMSLDTATEIHRQLKDIDYRGEVSITGRGEPTLHPKFDELCEIFLTDKTWTLKINTNGKRFDRYFTQIIQFDRIIYNVYSKPEDDYIAVMDKYNFIPHITIKHKPMDMLWYDRPSFTNRAGSWKTNRIPEDGRCDVIFLKLFIDWDGTYRVCCEDWKEKISMGTIFDQTIREYVEDSVQLQEYRLMLMNGERTTSPCNQCTHKLTDFKYGCTPERWKQLEWLVKMENLGA